MVRDITIGQYYPVNSRIHRLDPRVKIVCTLLFLISLFFKTSVLAYLLATVFLVAVVTLSKVPIKYILKGLKPVLMILMVTVVFNLFLNKGGEEYFSWKFLTLTEEGVRTAVYMAVRLIYLIIGSSLMTFTTTPNSLTDGIEKLLGGLKKIHVPVHEMAMMMSIALRFIPILLEETDKVMKAQLSRGADMENGNLLQRVKAMLPILIPLLISAFKRADDLSMAMESRGYRGGEGRTKMKPLQYEKVDYTAYILTILYVVLVFVIGRMIPFKLWIF